MSREYLHTLQVYLNGKLEAQTSWNSKRKQKKCPLVLKCTAQSYHDCISIEYNRVRGDKKLKRIWLLESDDFEERRHHYRCNCHINNYYLWVSTMFHNVDGSYDSKAYATYHLHWEIFSFSDKKDDSVGRDGTHPTPLPNDFYQQFPELERKHYVFCDALWEQVFSVEMLDYLLHNDPKDRSLAINRWHLAPIPVLEALLSRGKLSVEWWSTMSIAAGHGQVEQIRWVLEHIPQWTSDRMNLGILLKTAKYWHTKGRDNSKLIAYLKQLVSKLPIPSEENGLKATYDECTDKVAYIRHWFEQPDGYFSRATVGDSGLLLFSGVLELCAYWPSGTTIENADARAIDLVFMHPALKAYNSVTEWMAA
jgi:hypothetical protein